MNEIPPESADHPPPCVQQQGAESPSVLNQPQTTFPSIPLFSVWLRCFKPAQIFLRTTFPSVHWGVVNVGEFLPGLHFPGCLSATFIRTFTVNSRLLTPWLGDPERSSADRGGVLQDFLVQTFLSECVGGVYVASLTPPTRSSDLCHLLSWKQTNSSGSKRKSFCDFKRI